MKFRLIVLLLLLSNISAPIQRAQETQGRLLIPIGDSHSDTYDAFSVAAVTRISGDTVRILILPIAYTSDPLSMTDAERARGMEVTENNRAQIQASCMKAAPTSVVCEVVLVPIFIRSEAENSDFLRYFQPYLSAIYFLGDHPSTAMQVITGTLVETALEDAYRRGVTIAGAGGGAGILSKNMIGGYNQDFDSTNALDFGAIDVWTSPERSGLTFGLQDAILDLNILQRGHMARLLNATSLPDLPHLGVGVDAHTGVYIVDRERLENVFGLYSVFILDAETYRAADSVKYSPPRYTLSLRNVLIHLLSPGNFSYNLKMRQHSLASPIKNLKRSFQGLSLPAGAGPLILGGNLHRSLKGNPLLTRFINHSGGEKANLLIVATGYPSEISAQQALEVYQAALPIPSQTLIVPQDPTKPLGLPQDLTGIILIGADQTKLQPEYLLPIKIAWLSGIPLLTDDAASAMVGAHYSAYSPEDRSPEIATQKSILQGTTNLLPGLGLVNLTIEPRVMAANRWGRLISLAYNHPDILAIGLSESSALEITKSGAVSLGNNVVFTLDLSFARLDLGTNQGFVIANGLLDVFAPGATIRPEVADGSIAPIHNPTPDLTTPTFTPTFTLTPLPTDTPTPTLSPTPTIGPSPTRTRRPTRTLRPTPNVPPPADPEQANLMILLALVIVLVVLFGVLINRRRMI